MYCMWYRDGHCIQHEDKALTYSENGMIYQQSNNTNPGKCEIFIIVTQCISAY